jgi:hypothetical protein
MKSDPSRQILSSLAPWSLQRARRPILARVLSAARALARGGAIRAAMSGIALGITLGTGGCGGASEASTPAAALAATSAVATPTPTPTPIPKIVVQGEIAIKLARGVDIPAGLPARLLDARLFDALAREAAREADAELTGLLSQLSVATAQVSGSRRRALEAGSNIEKLYREAWEKAIAEELASSEASNARLERILESSDYAFLRLQPPAAATVTEAFERVASLRKALDAAIASSETTAEEDIRRLGDELDKERKIYESTYKFRENQAKASLERIGEYEAQVEHNAHRRVRRVLLRTRELAAESAAELQTQMERERDRVESVEPRAALLRKQVEADFPLWQEGRLKTAVREATVAETHADGRGHFSFRVDPGDYALFARYADPATGQIYLWAAPARADAVNVLGIYNTVSLENLVQTLPGLAELLYGDGGGLSDQFGADDWAAADASLDR